MLELNQTNKSLVTVDETDLIKENILERYDLQEAFVNSWDSFTKELEFNNLNYIGKEVPPHDTVNNRIDILAFEENDPSLIIFELKRDKNKNQLLQSISYAGMLHDWTIEDYKEKFNECEALIEYLQENENKPKIKIILIAEKYEPDVILAANWLKTKDIIIYAYIVKLNKVDNKLLLSFEQNFPLKDLSDSYCKPRKNIISDNKKTWEDVKTKIANEFEKKAIDELIKMNYYDDPSNKRIFVNNKDILYSIIFYMRNNFIKVVTTVKDKEQGRNLLKTILGNSFQIDDWRDGLTFKIEDEQTYLKFKEWLNL